MNIMNWLDPSGLAKLASVTNTLWTGEVRQSDGLSYRLCRVSVAKDGPSEAEAGTDLAFGILGPA